MTNNPTIDGVSREDLDLVLTYGCGTDSSDEAWDRLRALLDASEVEPPNVLREHCKQCAEVVKTWPEWKQNCLGGAPAVEQQVVPEPIGYVDQWEIDRIAKGQASWATLWTTDGADNPSRRGSGSLALFTEMPEVIALQSTIAQLQARIGELENGRGEPVAWLAEAVGPDGTAYRRTSSTTSITLRDAKYAWGDRVISKYEIKIQPLFTSPPAPVAVVHPFAEKVISKLRRFEECASDCDAGGVDIGRHWLDLLTQLGLLNRVQRSPALWEITQQGEACLDATAALNGERK